METENLAPLNLVNIELQKEFDKIPDRLGFKIGEVSKILEVKSYVLRYWESEFPFIRPKKSGSNRRHYTKDDIENLILLKTLLYDYKFSIKGARDVFKKIKKSTDSKAKGEDAKKELRYICEGMEELVHKIQTLKKAL